MKLNKKIVLLTPGFPADEQDSACLTYLQDLLLSYRALFSGEENVRVIAFQYPFREGDYNWNSIKVYSAGGSNKKFPFRPITWRKVLKKLNRISAEEGIDIIHSFWLTECTFIGQRFCHSENIKHIATIMGQDILESNRYFSRLDFAKMEITSVSDMLARRFENRTGKKANKIIPFGLNTGKLKIKHMERTIDIIGAGSLIPLKNYAFFIDLIYQLKVEWPEINAGIIGEGPERKMLQKKIERLNMQKNIELLGQIPHEEVFEQMCRSKIFLHTSSYEGQSLAAMEALYAGLPVVCFNTSLAYNGEKIQVCADQYEMLAALKKLMRADAGFEPLLIRTAAQTAEAYAELYSGK